ncbi:MAG: hypothetical protein MAG794_00500 [Gammaproteobacteria bacterium]|nr:hypothetical protein [Gammaproteobacteria bacterium]
MVIFFLVAVTLLLICLVLILPPLFRSHAAIPDDQQNYTIHLLKHRLQELQQRKQSGEIDTQELEETKADIERQLANDLRLEENRASQESSTARANWIGFTVMIVIPVLSGLLYLTLGTPRALVSEGSRQVSQTPGHSDNPGQIQAMVANLAKRLEANPGDAEGWLMLGQSYMSLERFQDAADAFAELQSLIGDVPEVLVRRADAIAMNQNGSFAGEPIRLVNLALEQDPNHPQSLWMAAAAAHRAGDLEKALGFYRKVEPLLEGQPKTEIQRVIQSLSAQGITASEPEAGVQADIGININVAVSLSDDLKSKARPGDTVFIFAKAVDGPPMPLAVIRKSVANLPVTVSLNDTRVMTPQFKLSQFDEVTIGAHVSKSGQPVPQTGDLQAESKVVSTKDTAMVSVRIDHVAP